jgi:hypothetical protein
MRGNPRWRVPQYLRGEQDLVVCVHLWVMLFPLRDRKRAQVPQAGSEADSQILRIVLTMAKMSR